MKKVLSLFGIVLLVVLVQFLFRPLFSQLELVSYDFRAKLADDSGPFSKQFKHHDKNIVIVSIDDYSRNELSKHPLVNPGAWPWRRDVWGNVVNFIEKGEPKAIMFDIIFADVNNSYYFDRMFSQTLRKYDNIVMATSLNSPQALVEKFGKKSIENNEFIPTGKPLDVEIYDKDLDNRITYHSHSPIYDIYTKYNTMAVVNKVVRGDSIIRSSQPIFKLQNDDNVYYLPSLAFAGFIKYMGEGDKVIIKNHKITYKNREIPIDEDGTAFISWHGRGHDYTYIPISKILVNKGRENDLKPEFFKDKLVIIGRTEAGTDIHASAVNSSYAGPEANATAMDNFINDTDTSNKLARKFISTLPKKYEVFIVLGICFLIGLFAIISKNALMAFIDSFLIIIFYVLVAFYAYIAPSIRIWLPIAVPLYYMLLTSAIAYSFRIQSESTKKAEIMNMFGKFVSPNVLSQLMKNPENLVLKSTKKHITTMFCDVKDFTTLSEKSDPEKLLSGLNELFDEIVGIIFKNNGTVDKFIGDCVMAYWGDPIASEDDEFMAVKTALEIKKRVDEMKIENIKEGKLILDVKLGVNTGDALLGLSGSDKIMSYTAMGDAVNIASRLESSCSKLGRDILISKSTYDRIKDKIVVLNVGNIDVKGKDEKIEVFEPIGFVNATEDGVEKDEKGENNG